MEASKQGSVAAGLLSYGGSGVGGWRHNFRCWKNLVGRQSL